MPPTFTQLLGLHGLVGRVQPPILGKAEGETLRKEPSPHGAASRAGFRGKGQWSGLSGGKRLPAESGARGWAGDWGGRKPSGPKRPVGTHCRKPPCCRVGSCCLPQGAPPAPVHCAQPLGRGSVPAPLPTGTGVSYAAHHSSANVPFSSNCPGPGPGGTPYTPCPTVRGWLRCTRSLALWVVGFPSLRSSGYSVLYPWVYKWGVPGLPAVITRPHCKPMGLGPVSRQDSGPEPPLPCRVLGPWA